MTDALQWLACVDWAGPGPRAVLLAVLFAAIMVLVRVLAQLMDGFFSGVH